MPPDAAVPCAARASMLPTSAKVSGDPLKRKEGELEGGSPLNAGTVSGDPLNARRVIGDPLKRKEGELGSGSVERRDGERGPIERKEGNRRSVERSHSSAHRTGATFVPGTWYIYRTCLRSRRRT